jgi:hypothetical protein
MRYLVLGSVANEPLCIREGHIAGGRPVTLVVSNNFHLHNRK